MRACLWLMAAIFLSSAGAAGALPRLDPISLAARINGDSSCTGYEIKGLCRRHGVMVGYLVKMNVPVAFVETVGAPGDSLLATPSFATLLKSMVGAAFSVAQSNRSGTDNSFESKVWVLPDSVMLLSPIMPKCLACMPSDSVDATGSLPELPSTGCEATNAVSRRLFNLAESLISIPYMPRLAYVSEADFLNWRTGCRDMTITNYMKSNAFTCTASSIADLVNKFGGIAQPLKDLLGESCLGAWGALFPRQMRDVGNVATVASAKTAYRALSVSKTQFGSVSFPVNMDGKMQQAYPSVSACFSPGQLPLPQLPLSLKPVVNSPDGAYGWIYWRPVTCCVSIASAAKCAKSLVQ